MRSDKPVFCFYCHKDYFCCKFNSFLSQNSIYICVNVILSFNVMSDYEMLAAIKQ